MMTEPTNDLWKATAFDVQRTTTAFLAAIERGAPRADIERLFQDQEAAVKRHLPHVATAVATANSRSAPLGNDRTNNRT